MNLNGWDTVFVGDMAVINAAMAASSAQLLQEFSFSQDGFSASGTFGTWQVVPGGSSELLLLQIALESGSMTMSAGTTPIDVSGMSVQLLVSLQLLPTGAGSGALALQFDFTAVGPANTSGAGVVTPHAVLDNGKLTLVQEAALGNAIANALVRNAGRISFMFASINPARAAAVPWIQPVASRYCYLAPAGMPPALAILSVNAGHSAEGLPLTVDPAVLQGDGNAGLAISPALFLQNVVGPALLQSLGSSGTLAVNSAGVLQNTGALPLREVDRAGESYHPQIDSLSVTVVDAQIQIAIQGSCDMHMGVSMTFSATSALAVALSTDRTSLQFSTVGTPTFHKDVSIPWYDHLFDIFGGIAEIILQVCVAAISSELGEGISGQTTSCALVGGAPSLVGWANGGGFSAGEATLASGFYMRGAL
ncbi:TULIP family P47-like protein [Cupriavidus oxalaticus]|uniref:TULIP family P47-like protein n=1 Tax=Cupriavidus oxalaticus TaxID=96344 RepID=UPI0031795293